MDLNPMLILNPVSKDVNKQNVVFSLSKRCILERTPFVEPRGQSPWHLIDAMWGNIPAKGSRIHPRPEAVAFWCRGKIETVAGRHLRLLQNTPFILKKYVVYPISLRRLPAVSSRLTALVAQIKDLERKA